MCAPVSEHFKFTTLLGSVCYALLLAASLLPLLSQQMLAPKLCVLHLFPFHNRGRTSRGRASRGRASRGTTATTGHTTGHANQAAHVSVHARLVRLQQQLQRNTAGSYDIVFLPRLVLPRWDMYVFVHAVYA